MNTKKKSNLMNLLMTLLFITIMSVLGLPMTVYAEGAHAAHTGYAGDSCHPGWQPISSAADLIELGKNGGSGYLTGDIELKSDIFDIDKSTRLCLNGYSIIEKGNKEVINLNSVLSLYDENDNSGRITHAEGYNGSGVNCKNTTLNMYGGTISENVSGWGGGVYLAEGSLLNLYGGKIVNNSASVGGGVYSKKGSIRLDGGSIIDNYASDMGGGVYLENSEMDSISGEILNNNSRYHGGGIYCGEGKLTISGGEIDFNNAKRSGGGIYCSNSTINITGGFVTGNSAERDGGGLYLNKSPLIMSGGKVLSNICSENGAGIYSGNSDSLIIYAGDIKNNLTTDSDNSFGGGLFYINSELNGILQINGGNIEGNSAINGGGIYSSGGTCIIKGGNISNNEAKRYGGGINIIKAKLTIEGGIISKNIASEGGGIGIDNGEICIIEGEIKNNVSNFDSDGVYINAEGYVIDKTVSDSIFMDSSVSSVTYNPNKGTGNKIIMYTKKRDGYEIKGSQFFARSGYSLYNWNTKANGTGKTYQEGEKTSLEYNSNLDLYAQWAPAKYTVKFDANGGSGTLASQSIKFDTATALKKNTFTKSGYEFAGWNTKTDGTGNSYKDGQKITLNFLNTNKITLYAQWKEEMVTYKVEYYLQRLDGTYAAKPDETVTFKGIPGTSATPKLERYIGFTAPVVKKEKIKADGSLVIKYYYTRNAYKLTWDFAGGSAKGEYTKGDVLYDSLIVSPAPTRKGYTFNGWNVEVPENMPANDLTIKAKWKAKTNTKYTVEHYKEKLDGTYPASASETEALTGKTNASVTPEVKTYKGFTSPEVQTAKIKADGTLVIKYYYKRNSYKLTWDFAGGSAVGKYTKGNVKYGAKITAPVPTRDGYKFTGWDKTVAEKMPAKAVTYKATWKKLTQEEQVRAFVERFYTIILDRPAEAAGLADWTNRLISKTATGADVAAGFINGAEFQKKKMTDEEYVTKLYRAFFDREPDKAGYEGWLKELKNGKSRDYVLRGFINSVEFNNLCKKYGINAGSY